MLQLGGISLEDLVHGAESIRHVHHIHIGAGLDRADEAPVLHGLVVDIHSVVGRTATGESDIGDQPGEAYRPSVDTKPLKVVVAQQLSGYLRHAVHRSGALDGVLRCLILRCGGTEGADGAGGEDGALLLSRHLEDVAESADTDVPGELRLCLCHCR